DDGVVDESIRFPAPAGATPRRLVHLAGQQYVARARRDGGGEVDDAEAVEGASRTAELVVHLQVLQQCRFAVDGESEQVTAPRGHRDLAFLVRQSAPLR